MLVVKSSYTLASSPGRVSWSPRGDRIAIDARGSDGLYDVFTVLPDGSGSSPVSAGNPDLQQLHNGQPAYKPDGRQILLQMQDGGLGKIPDYLAQGGAGVNNQLALAAVDGSGAKVLTAIKPMEGSLHPQFDAGGTRICWAALERLPDGRSQQWSIKVARLSVLGGISLTDIKTFRPFGASKTFYETHCFSPDGKLVYFTANIGHEPEEFNLDIWALDLATGGARKLTRQGLNEPAKEWNEHFQVIPRGANAGKIGIWACSRGYDFDSTDTASWQRTLCLDWWIMAVDGSGKRRLTNFNHDNVRNVAADSSWRPDGLAFAGSLANKIVVVELLEA